MANKAPNSWLEELLPFPRPEYAKQTEALLTDLIWRSDGSNLARDKYFEKLSQLRLNSSSGSPLDPERLIPRSRRQGGNDKLVQTYPLAEQTDTTTLIAGLTDSTLARAFLESIIAPRARGDKADACVPVHPSLVAMQTLHGLVNKESPANIALAIETMGWLGGATAPGAVAASFLSVFSVAAGPQDGTSGLIESLSPRIAEHVWASLASLPQWQGADSSRSQWPSVVAADITAEVSAPLLATYPLTPFTWFWKKWRKLTDPASRWHAVLPPRRYVDWAMCLLRTGLAFSYVWEAEFYTRLHSRLVNRALGSTTSDTSDPVGSMLRGGAVLATFEPPGIPSSQKGIWPAMSDLLARGHEARNRILDSLDNDSPRPPGAVADESLDAWVRDLSQAQIIELGKPLHVSTRTANNQKEFVKYLILPRSSDDDLVDQADFYYLARSNSRHTWFHPGPEWLVVVTSLLCDGPGGQCTLGSLQSDLVALGVRADRSVLVGLLEESGLSADSPDADNALVIKSGF